MRSTFVWIVLTTVALVACAGEGPTGPEGGGGPGDPATVEIVPGSVTFGALGSSVSLRGIVRDSDGTIVPGEAITWTAAAPGIVAVDATTGLVTSVANGSITVRGTAGNAHGTITVTVAQVPVTLSIGTPQGTFSVVGLQTTIQPVAADSNGNAITGAAFTYASTDPAVAHVDSQGVVTANGPGSAELSVTLGSMSDTRGVVVNIFGPQGGAIVGGEVVCSGGFAGPFPCDRVDLVSYLPLSGLGAPSGVELNDMWGWTDPSSGIEYALVGRTDGLTFVELSDPESPRAVGHLPAAAAATIWRDVKVYMNHAYVVADNSPGHGVQVFDLTRLRGVEAFTTFSEDARYTELSSVHNIAINEATGFAYAVGSNGGGNTCGGGLHMIDLSNPKSPSFAGCYNDPSTGDAGSPGYSHDVQCVVYAGPDGAHVGKEVCIGSNETAISIADVTSKVAPVSIATATYPDHSYVHQGWLTEDHRYFLQNDEIDELDGTVGSTRMMVWDLSDLDDPVLVDEHFGPTGATDHNMYVRNGVLYHSNYHFGVRILDVTSPTAPVESGFFDTHPPNNSPGFDGSWSNYPYWDSGNFGATSAQEGLFILRRQP